MKLEYSTENLDFLKAIHELYLKNEKPSQGILMGLYNDFANPDNKDGTLINLPGEKFTSLKKAVEDGSLELSSFADAAQEIMRLTQDDSVNRCQKANPSLIAEVQKLMPNPMVGAIQDFFQDSIPNFFSQIAKSIKSVFGGTAEGGGKSVPVKKSEDVSSAVVSETPSSKDKVKPKESVAQPMTTLFNSKKAQVKESHQVPPSEPDPADPKKGSKTRI